MGLLCFLLSQLDMQHQPLLNARARTSLSASRCLAHSRQVRLVWAADYDVKQLDNATARTEWVRTQVDKVKATFTDGINIDLEDETAAGSEAAQQYTALVQELTDLLRAQVLGAKVCEAIFSLKH